MFDMEAAIKKPCVKAKALTVKTVLTPLIKQLTRSAIQTELDSHPAEDSDNPNRKNGKAGGYGACFLPHPTMLKHYPLPFMRSFSYSSWVMVPSFSVMNFSRSGSAS